MEIFLSFGAGHSNLCHASYCPATCYHMSGCPGVQVIPPPPTCPPLPLAQPAPLPLHILQPPCFSARVLAQSVCPGVVGDHPGVDTGGSGVHGLSVEVVPLLVSFPHARAERPCQDNRTRCFRHFQCFYRYSSKMGRVYLHSQRKRETVPWLRCYLLK